MSGHATTMATTGMYTMRPVVVLSKECPQSRCMYEMRSIHKDRCEDPYREAADTAAEAKMPDDIGTQVNRLLQVSVSFPPLLPPRFRPDRAQGPTSRPYPRPAVAIARDMMTPPENFT